ncbi:MAG: hypothetical protein JWN59_667 [Sphingomonas bacterium]|nr:hypothetical protein [Sphingomonas bacterium]
MEATELTVRSLPLYSYDVIVFATHRRRGGDVRVRRAGAGAHPARSGQPRADRLLKASEMALLKISADGVILSACNTAAGDGSPRAEPLSGPAKSFFYAGPRSLLVTHWAGDSQAAAKLTVAAVRARMTGASSAMAIGAAAIDFIDDRDGSRQTPPAVWASVRVCRGLTSIEASGWVTARGSRGYGRRGLPSGTASSGRTYHFRAGRVRSPHFRHSR